ncbi:MAG: hypothetical protein JEZ06_16740 [Anaerolineaceae bacterium]|nr:hypothetical protein [Anaerolineaceae bacterium]
MYHLATIFPRIKKIQFPLSRDLIMLFMVAVNELLLGFETYSAHIISGTIVFREWIPIIVGPVSGLLLIITSLLLMKKKQAGVYMGITTLLISLIVGFLGAFYHISRAVLFSAPAGQQVSVPLLIWAPPVIAPLTFCLLSLLGMVAIFKESPIDSGILQISAKRTFHMPISKTRFFLIMAGMGILATVISSVLDHARTDFSNPWLWFPTAVGIFSCITAMGAGFLKSPNRGDLFTFAIAMLLMILTGLIGLILHIQFDLAPRGVFILERFIRGAPPLAPMLFADMGALGLIALLNPADQKE